MNSFQRFTAIAVFIALPLVVVAAPAEKDIKQPAKLSASISMGDTLKSLMTNQSPVELVLRNGKIYGGMVKEVGSAHVVLTKLNQKEFYDAVIKIDDISAVEVRVR